MTATQLLDATCIDVPNLIFKTVFKLCCGMSVVVMFSVCLDYLSFFGFFSFNFEDVEDVCL